MIDTYGGMRLREYFYLGGHDRINATCDKYAGKFMCAKEIHTRLGFYLQIRILERRID